MVSRLKTGNHWRIISGVWPNLRAPSPTNLGRGIGATKQGCGTTSAKHIRISKPTCTTQEASTPQKTTHPNHSGAGAILAYEKWHNIIGKTLAYLVAGHHAGLPDWFGGRDSLPYRLESEKIVADTVRNYAEPFFDAIPVKLRPPDFAMHCRNQDAIAYHLWVRMVYSCLVDADFLDTEAFMEAEKHAQRPSFPSLIELKACFDQQMRKMMADAPDTFVNSIRANILATCRTAAAQSPGFFSLTVPTGGGKTLSGTAFALYHTIQYDKSRIIYVIPYTSIIEQTADVLRKHFGSENVIEHHSNIAPEREKESPHLTLAAENWDAPVIVTTSVQFFESLYAAKPGRCRKLHNIVNSVVILDEAQLLPPELLHPCVEALNRLVSDYRVTVVLSTATQPALPNLCQPPREIIPYTASLYEQLKRTNIVFPATGLPSRPNLPSTNRFYASSTPAQTAIPSGKRCRQARSISRRSCAAGIARKLLPISRNDCHVERRAA
jgi:CRISPR-associated endonuclease/helicase Cas3